MNAIATVGPLAVNVQADVWKAYSAGVFSGCTNKSNIDINHVVQLVGYGTDSSLGDYWLVRPRCASTRAGLLFTVLTVALWAQLVL